MHGPNVVACIAPIRFYSRWASRTILIQHEDLSMLYIVLTARFLTSLNTIFSCKLRNFLSVSQNGNRWRGWSWREFIRNKNYKINYWPRPLIQIKLLKIQVFVFQDTRIFIIPFLIFWEPAQWSVDSVLLLSKKLSDFHW